MRIKDDQAKKKRITLKFLNLIKLLLVIITGQLDIDLEGPALVRSGNRPRNRSSEMGEEISASLASFVNLDAHAGDLLIPVAVRQFFLHPRNVQHLFDVPIGWKNCAFLVLKLSKISGWLGGNKGEFPSSRYSLTSSSSGRPSPSIPSFGCGREGIEATASTRPRETFSPFSRLDERPN